MLICVANERLTPNDKELEKIKNIMGLGGLAHAFKPCVSEEFFNKLVGFSKDRNALVHHAADTYMNNLIVEMDEEEVAREIWKFEENKRVAGELAGELLDLQDNFRT